MVKCLQRKIQLDLFYNTFCHFFMIEEAGVDLYSLDLMPIQVDETTRQELVEKARNFHSESEQLKNSQFFSHPQFYIISTKYLTRWKVYVGYHETTGSQEVLGKLFGAGDLPIANQDIVESVNKFDIEFSGDNDVYNVVLKPGLAEGRDYIFATKSMWEALIRGTEKNKYIEVRRKVVTTNDQQKVEMYYEKLNIIPICNQILKDVEYDKRSSFLSYNLQFSHYATVEELGTAIKQKISNKLPYEYSCKIAREFVVKLWLAAQKSQKQIIFNTFIQGCKANATFSYRLHFDGQKLDEEQALTKYDIFQDSLIFMEIKEEKMDWCFFNKKNILVSACTQCRGIEKLQYFCSCKFVAYCSKQCKIKDRTYHEGRCPNNAESDTEEKQQTENQESRKGVVGLRNLGNTCFMNSGLQCISHSIELTQYFLTNRYVKDINRDNPLGTKGELCLAFAHMLKNLWFGNQSSFSPTQLKRAIGKFQPMFSGYNQHDSGQLISYLLDGLHEDLNRVKVKPYVEVKDYDQNIPESIVAAQQWSNFLKRNQSEIVNLMYGQYRSVVDCPTCNKRSIKFDPFSMCSLPLKNSTLKKMKLVFLEKQLNSIQLQVSFDKSWGYTMKDIAVEVQKQINKPNAKLFFYAATQSFSELISITRKASEVRSEYKYRTIYVRQMHEEQVYDQGIRISLGNTIPHHYYKDQSYRKSITLYRLYSLKPTLTLKQTHHLLYQFFKQMYPIKDYQTQVINQVVQQQPLRLLAIATSRYNDCQYCGNRSCDGCPVPYTDMLLADFVKKCDSDRIQFQIFWRKGVDDVQRRFDQYGEGKGGDLEDNLYKKGEATIQDCFRLFSEPETLAEENAYYCPNCKDFVLAKKQMQIYKAPKIMAICLKRFKRKEYFSEKDSLLIDFPLQNLDLSEFILNKNLPTHEPQDPEPSTQPNGPVLYNLFAISNHFGSTGGGHYTAFCKNPYTEEWYDFDDSSVSKISKKGVVSESAYILFYRRKL